MSAPFQWNPFTFFLDRVGDGGGGSIPGDVAQTYVFDDGSGVPVNHVFNIKGAALSTDTVNGIYTRANPDGSINGEVALTNRLNGTATSTNGSTENIISFTLSSMVSKCYRFNIDIIGRDTDSGDCVGYTLLATFKTNGATANIVSVPYIDNDEDASLLDASINMVGSGNDAVLQVTGVADRTISYRATGYYVVV